MRISRYWLAPALALALGALTVGPAAAETMERTVEKTTTYRGTVSEINPTSSTIILRSETASAPTTYTYNKETKFVDSSGNVVSYEVIKNTPVTVQYTQEGDRMIVTKVIQQPTAVKKETTTTTTDMN